MVFFDIKICVGVPSENNNATSFHLLKSEEECMKLLHDYNCHCESQESDSAKIEEYNSVTSDKIQAWISLLLRNVKILHCEWFRNFLSVRGLRGGETLPNNSALTACDFILQPVDNVLVYVPRRKSFFVDSFVAACDSLVWRFINGSSTDMTLKVLFQRSRATNISDESVKDMRACFDAFSGGASVLGVQEVQCCGGTSGSFQAPAAGVVRLCFDNPSLFRGNYLEYCVQCVSFDTMQAAKTAATDLAYAAAHNSSLVAALAQRAEDHFLEVCVNQHDDDDVCCDEEQKKRCGQTEVVEDVVPSPGVAAGGGWMSSRALDTLSGIAFAGKLVNATVAGLSGFRTSASPSPDTVNYCLKIFVLRVS